MTMDTLRQIRRNLGIRQADFKTLCGLSQKGLSRIETGRVRPKEKIRQRIEAQLGPVDWLNGPAIKIHKTHGFSSYECETAFRSLLNKLTSLDQETRQAFIKYATKHLQDVTLYKKK